MMGGGSLYCGLCVVESGNETKTKTSHEGLMRDVRDLNVSCFMTLESRDARGSGYERYARRGRGPILIPNERAVDATHTRTHLNDQPTV